MGIVTLGKYDEDAAYCSEPNNFGLCTKVYLSPGDVTADGKGKIPEGSLTYPLFSVRRLRDSMPSFYKFDMSEDVLILNTVLPFAKNDPNLKGTIAAMTASKEMFAFVYGESVVFVPTEDMGKELTAEFAKDLCGRSSVEYSGLLGFDVKSGEISMVFDAELEREEICQ